MRAPLRLLQQREMPAPSHRPRRSLLGIPRHPRPFRLKLNLLASLRCVAQEIAMPETSDLILITRPFWVPHVPRVPKPPRSTSLGSPAGRRLPKRHQGPKVATIRKHHQSPLRRSPLRLLHNLGPPVRKGKARLSLSPSLRSRQQSPRSPRDCSPRQKLLALVTVTCKPLLADRSLDC